LPNAASFRVAEAGASLGTDISQHRESRNLFSGLTSAET
jgi:hypothetical protein